MEKELQEEFERLKNKYSLPEMIKLDEDFDVEKNMEKESNFILREIRRPIHEKMSAYLQLVETILNPVSPPLFVFSMIKGLNEDDKTKLKEIYKKLSKFQIEVTKLDTIYSEEKEAKYIKKAFIDWQEIKANFIKITEKFDNNLDVEEATKDRGYFG